MLGFPLTTVIVPIWMHQNMTLPAILQFDDKLSDAPLCHWALQLKKEAYDIRWGSSKKYYLNINVLLNANRSGYLQVLPELEAEILSKSMDYKAAFDSKGIDVAKLNTFYLWIDERVESFYLNRFPQLKEPY